MMKQWELWCQALRLVFSILRHPAISEPKREPHSSCNTLLSSWGTAHFPQGNWRGRRLLSYSLLNIEGLSYWSCFLIIYHLFEGLPLFIRAAALRTVQSVAPGSKYGNETRSNTWAFLVHKSFCECKRNLGVIQAVSQSQECSACHCLHLPTI